jgi:SM-20-related protein
MDNFLSLAVSPAGETVAEGLRQRGWWVQPGYFDTDLIEQLREELQNLHAADTLYAAGIGRGLERQIDASIRRDAIRWLNRDTPPQRRYLDCMEALRQEINRELFLGLFEFEAHYAVYESGAFYQKHLDSFRGAANRVVSAVAYLNRDWPEDGGGELLLFDPGDDARVYKVMPEAGTLAVFLSEEIPHEVAVTHRQRAGIAGWFRINASTHDRLNPPR